MSNWIHLARSETIGEKSDIIDAVPTFAKCKEHCEKTIDCKAVTYVFKQCKLQSGNIFVDANMFTVNSFCEGGIIIR